MVDSLSRRIVQRNKSNKCKTSHREPSIRLRLSIIISSFFLSFRSVFGPCVPVLDVGLESLWVEFISREVESSEGKNSFSKVSKVNILLVNKFEVIFNVMFFSFNENLRAPVYNPVGSTLHEYAKTSLVFRDIIIVREVSDDHVEFNFRAERDLGSGFLSTISSRVF